MAVNSGFWRNAFWTLSSVPFSVLTSCYLDEPQSERVQLESSSLPNATDVLPASNGDATNLAPEAPDPMPGPTLAPQPRSWFASLSRRSSSNVALNELAQKTPPPPPGEQPAGVQSVQSTAAAAVSTTLPPDERASEIPFASEPQEMAANAGQPESETKLIPRKRAWFAPSSSTASLTSNRVSKLRHTDGPSLPVDTTRKDLPIPETTQPPVMNIIPPTPPKLELARVEGGPLSEAAPVPIPVTRKWFSSASPPQARSPEMETRAVLPSASSQSGAPSSLDDQATNLASASVSAGLSSESVSSADSQNLPALNSSASRFSLTIPFLGRPKVPLERPTPSAPHANDIRLEPDTSPLPEVEKAETAPEATGEFSQKMMIRCNDQVLLQLQTAPLQQRTMCCFPGRIPRRSPAQIPGGRSWVGELQRHTRLPLSRTHRQSESWITNRWR